MEQKTKSVQANGSDEATLIVSPKLPKEADSRTLKSPDAADSANELADSSDNTQRSSFIPSMPPGMTATRLTDGSSGGPNSAFTTPVEERYETLELLGMGGMGRVFRARDHKLARFVALKFLRDNEPALVGRFLKEAQAQARIEHEYVCKIYEAGEIAGEPYIAMQLIEGPSLKGVRDDLTLDQKLEIMAKVAEGLHAAHRIGLIHRDVKPSNIMLDPKEDGTWHPYVMDFGLARDMTGASGHTQTESAVGTPSYMAPEQVTGQAKKLDARTDVYGMGATLYDLLAGRPPFIGETQLEVLARAAYDDPLPLRTLNKSIPIDVQTIVMKCLEKDPARRYESARALSEDLERYRQRAGPIKAKRTSLAYTLYKKAKRHWPIVLLCSGLLLSGLVSLGIWVRGTILARQREALAEELGQTVVKIELFLRYATALPVHDMTAEKSVIQDEMRFLENTLATGGTNSAGPAHYALGRGHLALKKYAQAKTNLELALDNGYSRPEVHYALGLALGKLYEQAIDKAQRIGDKKLRNEKKEEAERSYRDPSLVHLRQSEGTQIESKTYIDALVALYEKRYEEALVKAAEAVKAAPWLYEARKVEGDARFAQGMAAKDGGKVEEARAEFTKGVVGYSLAAEMARSDGMLHEALAETWIQILDMDVNLARLNKEAFDGAIAACEQALKANPESANAYSKRGRAYSHLGMHQINLNQNVRATMEKAIENATAALKLDPEDGITWDLLGTSYRKLAIAEKSEGQDPSAMLNEATKSFDQAIKHQPTLAWAWSDAGNAWLIRAEWAVSRGQDPKDIIARGVELYSRAASLDVTFPWAHTGIALLMREGARYELRFGRDPGPYIKKGMESSNHAIQLRPAFGFVYFSRALLLRCTADYELHSRAEPTQSLTQAEADLRTAAEQMSDESDFFDEQAGIYHLRALQEIRKGADPFPTLDQGRAALKRAVELSPEEPALRGKLAQVELTAARHAAMKGQNPEMFIENARTALEVARKSKASDADVHVSLAEFHAFRAEYAKNLPVNFEEEIQQGLLEVNTALDMFPDMPLALAVKGSLELMEARSKAGNERERAAKMALATLERALLKNSLLPERIRLHRDEAKRLTYGKQQ